MTGEGIEAFDLPDHCEPDHVAIYENPDPYEPPYHAIPYDHVATWDDGTRHLQETDSFTVTEQYREAVAEQATVNIEDVKLRRELYTAEEIEPI